MTRKAIVSIDCEIPGSLSKFVPFESLTSLLDWDIIMFNPSITEFTISYDSYQGKPSLSADRSFRLKEASDHWKRELSEAFLAGKTIFVFLPELQEVYIDTGRREYSGTGRNRQTTQIVSVFNNFLCIPLNFTAVASQGKSMKLTKAGAILADYWRQFAGESNYKVLISGKIDEPLLVTKSGDKTVGALFQSRDSTGSILLLPHLNLWSETFYEDELESDEGVYDEDEEENRKQDHMVWTEAGITFGNKLLKCIVEIDRALRAYSEITPEPDWIDNSIFVLPQEATVKENLLKVKTKLEDLEKRKIELKANLTHHSSPKRLLYEKGKVLENAILYALKTIGFEASPYKDTDSEFDVVFESTEGRFLGEAEGKDSKPINIDKLRQLEMNIHEDFEREEIDEMAKGALFGNAYRLQPLGERKDFFTIKCQTAAKRSGTALIRTIDLFPIVQYLSGKKDTAFAKKCRQAIFDTSGDVVTFPVPPHNKSKESVKEAKNST